MNEWSVSPYVWIDGAADAAVRVDLVVRLDGRPGAALHRFFERRVGVVDLERDVAHAVAVQLEVVGRRMVGR